ncbi:MAG: ROK family protein [Granulosicoccaceae bacterium]
MMRFGIDFGGTKIEIIALDDRGRAVLRERVPTPAGYAQRIEAVAGLVESARDCLAISDYTIGIATPGAVSSRTGRMKNCNSVCLNDQPLREDFERRLGQPVRLSNDANCFALSEATDGAAAGAASVFGVILGTGVGGGIVINGRLHEGANAIAGEWGHNPLPWPQDDERPGPACYCGGHGCIETFLSGPGMSADHERRTGLHMTAEQIAANLEHGDESCIQTRERYLSRLARALAHVVNILDPEVIVLGGGVSNMQAIYTRVPQYWQPWIFSDQVETKLVCNQHGDSSGVRGAAWLWNE